jgi:large subunit ribosomal protein L18
MKKNRIIRYAKSSDRRKIRIRGKIAAVSQLPRLSVVRSNKYIYAQLMDGVSKKTVAGVRGTNPEVVGQAIAEKALKAGIKKAAFDRGAYNYHGRVKLLAEAVRKAGVQL